MKTLMRVAIVTLALSALSTTTVTVERKSVFDGPLPTCIPDLEDECLIPTSF